MITQGQARELAMSTQGRATFISRSSKLDRADLIMMLAAMHDVIAERDALCNRLERAIGEAMISLKYR